MNSFSNAQVIEGSVNRAKGTSTIFSDYMNGIANVSFVYHGRQLLLIS